MDNEPKLDPPWEVRSDLYIGVGQTISVWASMEDTIIEIAALILESTKEKTGLVFYSIMNFHAWLNIIDDLYAAEDKFTEHRDEWTKISAELRAMNDIRVRLAHHTVWGKSNQGQQFGLKPGRFDTRMKSKKYAPLTSEEIGKFSDSIRVIEARLEALFVKMGGRSQLEMLFSSNNTSRQLIGGLLGGGAPQLQKPIEPEGQPPPSKE